MNFLAHYYLDQEQASSLFVLGAATPDLLSIYNSTLRIKAGQVDHMNPETKAHGNPEFLQGLARHFHADRVFHSSPLFAQTTHDLSVQLQEELSAHVVPRKYFVAHILLELILDKVLIRRDPNILPEYYHHFESLAPWVQVRIATETVSGHLLPNYETFLQKFVENKYLYHYTENDHLIYILRRLLRRVGIEENHFLDDPKFPKLMDAYEEQVAGFHHHFFDEIRAKE